MNFLEAATLIDKGGRMWRESWLPDIAYTRQRISQHICWYDIMANDWEVCDILEDVEIKRYMILGVDDRIYTTREAAENIATITESSSVIELTGVYKQEIKPKKKIREHIGCKLPYGNTIQTGGSAPVSCRVDIYAEWEV